MLSKMRLRANETAAGLAQREVDIMNAEIKQEEEMQQEEDGEEEEEIPSLPSVSIVSADTSRCECCLKGMP